MQKAFKPNRGRMVVEILPVEEGLVKIPDSAKDGQAKRRARILAVGGEELNIYGDPIGNDFATGQIVILSMFTQLEQIVGAVVAVRFGEVVAIEWEVLALQ